VKYAIEKMHTNTVQKKVAKREPMPIVPKKPIQLPQKRLRNLNVGITK
jgi:hypothetical protein